jgi:plastocyanin
MHIERHSDNIQDNIDNNCFQGDCMSKKWLWVGLVLVLSMILAGCGGGQKAAPPVSFDIEMSEYVYTPDVLEVKVGQEVTLNLVNLGKVEHELMIGQQVIYEDGRPNGFQEDLFASAGVEPEMSGGMPMSESTNGHMHDNPGVMMILPAGETGTITFPVTKDMVGEWEMACFSQEGVHYTAGMVGKLVVTP